MYIIYYMEIAININLNHILLIKGKLEYILHYICVYTYTYICMCLSVYLPTYKKCVGNAMENQFLP